MADTTQFVIGAEAYCSDGAVGRLSRVIVDPVAEAVTHLVVDQEREIGHGRLVPLALVDCSSGEIRIRCTKAEYEDLDPAEETQYIQATTDYGGYDANQVGYLPFFGLGGGMLVPDIGAGLGAPPTLVTTDTVPLGEVDVRRGQPVQATDGPIGHVQGLVIDPASRHVTHVLLQEGHLWGRKEVAIPISAIAGTSDGIELTIAKQDVQDLPPVDVSHPEKRP